MEKDEWKRHFSIVHHYGFEPITEIGQIVNASYWLLVNKSTGEICGKYRDGHYAEKQARRKYKKIVRNMERVLLS